MAYIRKHKRSGTRARERSIYDTAVSTTGGWPRFTASGGDGRAAHNCSIKFPPCDAAGDGFLQCCDEVTEPFPLFSVVRVVPRLFGNDQTGRGAILVCLNPCPRVAGLHRRLYRVTPFRKKGVQFLLFGCVSLRFANKADS